MAVVSLDVLNLRSLIFSTFLLIGVVQGRIHKLQIKEDGRKTVMLTTFGLLKDGYISLNFTKFHMMPYTDTVDNNTFGFILEKSSSSGISPYTDKTREKCSLRQGKAENDTLLFKMDFQNKRLVVVRSQEAKDLTSLKIFTSKGKRTRRKRSAGIWEMLSDSAVMRVKREAEDKGKEAQPETVTGAAAQNKSQAAAVTDKPKQEAPTKTSDTEQEVTNGIIPIVRDDTTNNGNPRFSVYFKVQISDYKDQGLYNLYFKNCGRYGKTSETFNVNFTALLVEENNGNYLSAGEQPLPILYFTLCIIFFILACVWTYVIKTSKDGVFKIHYLMLVLAYFKSLTLLFHGIHFYFIQKEGHHEEAFSILYYITHLMKGALLFITIVLIGAGWTFVKHILSDRDKKIFMIIIPLQVLANVAHIIIEETEEGESEYFTWKEVFVAVDLLCCGAILFPVVWSIRHLQDASTIDGKAAINLQKLKIFRHFYILIVCYIYFTRIIVYLLKITVPFQYEWLDELFKEAATCFFYVVTAYKFRPTSNNPYLQLSQDSDDEMEMDEVVTQSGAYDGLTKVNIRMKGTKKEEEAGPKQRESSHEYD